MRHCVAVEEICNFVWLVIAFSCFKVAKEICHQLTNMTNYWKIKIDSS